MVGRFELFKVKGDDKKKLPDSVYIGRASVKKPRNVDMVLGVCYGALDAMQFMHGAGQFVLDG
jgi:hypothetical protein